MSSEAPGRNFEAPQQAKQETSAFTDEYVQRLDDLKDRMDGKGELGMEGKDKADAKVRREVLKTLNSSSGAFLLVKSEIGITNFFDETAGPAFVLPIDYDTFVKTEEGQDCLSNIVRLGTQSLARQYTEGFKPQQERFNRAHNIIVTKPYLEWQNDPSVKILSKIAENLGKQEKDVTFEDAAKSGLFGIKPPSIEEIVIAGLTAMEYANPRTDRQAYNKIQKRKRMVQAYGVEDILSFDTGGKLKLEKARAKTEKMIELNKARQSIDADVRNIVNEFTKTKEADLHFYATDGKEADSMHADLSFAAKSMPQIVIANGKNPLMVIDIAIHNGRTSYDLSVVSGKDKGAKISFDAEVARDKHGLLMNVKNYLAGQHFPDRKPAAPKPAPAAKPAPKATRNLAEDPDLKWMESLKESPKMDLTADNVGKLIIGLRKQQPNLAAKSEVMTYVKFKGNFGGLRIKRIAEGDNNRYIAGFIFPPNKQQQATILVPRNIDISDKNADDMYSGRSLYGEITAVLEGRPNGSVVGLAEAARIAAEAEPANAVSPKYFAQLAEKMDENLMKGKPLQWAFEVNYKGTPAKLTIRRQLISAEKAGMPEKHEGGYVKYEMALLTPPSTQPYGDVLVTDRPVFNDWDDLGAKLYRKLENAVDKKKK